MRRVGIGLTRAVTPAPAASTARLRSRSFGAATATRDETCGLSPLSCRVRALDLISDGSALRCRSGRRTIQLRKGKDNYGGYYDGKDDHEGCAHSFFWRTGCPALRRGAKTRTQAQRTARAHQGSRRKSRGLENPRGPSRQAAAPFDHGK